LVYRPCFRIYYLWVNNLAKIILKNTVARWHAWGVLFIIALGSLLHFAFAFLGKPVWLAFLFPVNESVWEHLKMAYWPALLWWIIGYFTLRRQAAPGCRLWFSAAAAALIVPLFVIVMLYYFYTGVFGIESVIVDIAIYVLAVLAGQAVGVYCYRRLPERWPLFFMAVLVILGLAAAFVWFTYDPPAVDLFYDHHHHSYGIN
jgi:hypothetical protein